MTFFLRFYFDSSGDYEFNYPTFHWIFFKGCCRSSYNKKEKKTVYFPWNKKLVIKMDQSRPCDVCLTMTIDRRNQQVIPYFFK